MMNDTPSGQSRLCQISELVSLSQRALAGEVAQVNIFQGVLTLKYGDHPLSRYSVE
jgi:hypothetical protein